MFSSQSGTTAALGSRNQLKHNRIFGSTPELFEEARICVCKKRHLLDFLTRHVKGRVGGNEEEGRREKETSTGNNDNADARRDSQIIPESSTGTGKNRSTRNETSKALLS
ncbi:hypothetical protein V1478_013052 [Vespula squamosa]|uniref:Uncharacterized protein n=1 Tax=Vespula squamosa TaxID=30214 RepID=A0ABD2AAJ6_VESSQ